LYLTNNNVVLFTILNQSKEILSHRELSLSINPAGLSPLLILQLLSHLVDRSQKQFRLWLLSLERLNDGCSTS
jgi:hypothetical protein